MNARFQFNSPPPVLQADRGVNKPCRRWETLRTVLFIGPVLFIGIGLCMIGMSAQAQTPKGGEPDNPASSSSLDAESTSDSEKPSSSVKRPNFVWIMSEDNSKHYLKHFDPAGVATPAIEALAAQGITFDRAFSNAPVCSVARTTLITGCYGPRIGTHFHRRAKLATLPADLEMFPVYFRQAGYYTTNNSKTDYNAEVRKEPWDESSRKATWSNRPDSKTPFLHVETHADSHESRLHFKQDAFDKPTDFDASTVEIPPYLPDTKLFRHTAAYYRDRMQVIDSKVAGAVSKLREAGELENTFVVYFGDHGGVLPRSKGYVFETGLHVPLVVRIPKNFQHLVDRKPGSRTTGFVSFIDFAPTMMHLAGLEVPDEMDGQPFLGQDVSAVSVDERDTTFSYADRMDEKYDFVRAFRVGDWKYIRYFESHYPDSLENEYRYNMLAYRQWRDQFHAGELNDVQSQFFRSRMPEALYHLADDPHETNNLAIADEGGNQKHLDQLLKMRRVLFDHMQKTNDLSLVPEAIFLQAGITNPTGFGKENSADFAKYLETANIAMLPWDQAKSALLTAVNSGDPWQRYWAIVAASSIVGASPELATSAATDEAFVKLVRRRTLDTEPLVCARAAELLMILDLEDPRPVFYRCVARCLTEPEVVQVLNMAAYAHGLNGQPYPIDASQLKFPFKVPPKSEVGRRLKYFQSAN